MKPLPQLRYFNRSMPSFQGLISDSQATWWSMFRKQRSETTSATALEALLLQRANESHKQYPQYKNAWDNHKLGVVVKTIVGKARTIKKGEYVLMKLLSKEGDDKIRSAYGDVSVYTTYGDNSWLVSIDMVSPVQGDHLKVCIYQAE